MQRNEKGQFIKGMVVSEEDRKKLSLALKGKKHTKEHNIKSGLGNRGKVRTPEMRKRASEKAKKNPNMYWLGKKRSELDKKKMSEAQLKNPNRYWLGKQITKEHREKSSKGWFKKGEMPHNFQNYKSREPYSVDWSKTLRRGIRERDKYTCQLCGDKQEDHSFDVHHIDYNKENCNPENLITLCRKCHGKTSHNREYWLRYFKDIQKIK